MMVHSHQPTALPHSSIYTHYGAPALRIRFIGDESWLSFTTAYHGQTSCLDWHMGHFFLRIPSTFFSCIL